VGILSQHIINNTSLTREKCVVINVEAALFCTVYIEQNGLMDESPTFSPVDGTARIPILFEDLIGKFEPNHKYGGNKLTSDRVINGRIVTFCLYLKK